MRKYILPLILLATVCFSFTINDWFKYASAEGKYQIQMPKQPVEQPQVIETELGELTLNMVMYDASADGDENFIYLVNYTDYPTELIDSENADLVEEFLTASVNGSAANVGGEIVETKDISINDYPGKEVLIELEMGTAVIDMKVYLVNNRMYMLQVITTPDNLNNSNALKFFESFKLN